MDTFTIVLLIVTILLAIACIILAVTKWKSWSDTEKAAVASQLMAIARAVAEALKDGRIDAGELKLIFHQIVALISIIIKQDPEVIEANITPAELDDGYQVSATTTEQS